MIIPNLPKEQYSMPLPNDYEKGNENEVQCPNSDLSPENRKPQTDPRIDHDNLETECPKIEQGEDGAENNLEKAQMDIITDNAVSETFTPKAVLVSGTTIKRRLSIDSSQDVYEKNARDPQGANPRDLLASEPKKRKITDDEDMHDEGGTASGLFASFEHGQFDKQEMSSPAKEIGPHIVRSDANCSSESRTSLDQTGCLNSNSASLKIIQPHDGDKIDMGSKHSPGPVMQITQEGADKTSSGDMYEKNDTLPSFVMLQQETERLKKRVMCKICQEYEIGIIFLPCQHWIACIDCGKELLKCRDCDSIIREKRKTKL